MQKVNTYGFGKRTAENAGSPSDNLKHWTRHDGRSVHDGEVEATPPVHAAKPKTQLRQTNFTNLALLASSELATVMTPVVKFAREKLLSPVSTTRVDGLSTRLVETGHPSTRAVNSGRLLG